MGDFPNGDLSDAFLDQLDTLLLYGGQFSVLELPPIPQQRRVVMTPSKPPAKAPVGAARNVPAGSDPQHYHPDGTLHVVMLRVFVLEILY